MRSDAGVKRRPASSPALARRSDRASPARRGDHRTLRSGPPPGGAARWERTNYAGRTVELHAGPAALPSVRRRRSRGAARPDAGAPPPSPSSRPGLRGVRRHWRARAIRGAASGRTCGALRGGEVTRGAVKLFGISAAGLAAGALLKERPVDKVLAGVVIAGTAHLVNLVDVRPGPGRRRRGRAAARRGCCAEDRRGPRRRRPWGPRRPCCRTTSGSAPCSATPGAHALGAALGHRHRRRQRPPGPHRPRGGPGGGCCVRGEGERGGRESGLGRAGACLGGARARHGCASLTAHATALVAAAV